MNLKKVRKKVNDLLSNAKAINHQHASEKEALAAENTHLVNIKEAQSIAQSIAQSVQQQAHKQISGVVSSCLKSVFYDEDYGFKINFEKKRGRTEAKLIILKDGREIDKPIDAESGGVLDVASFALRVASLVLSKPKLRRLLIMDEPFKNVSIEYQENISLMLKKLAEDFGMQIILVTHITNLSTGKRIRL